MSGRRRRGLIERLVAWMAPCSRTRAPEEYCPKTVEALVDEAKYHAAFEESRLNAVQQRASWLLAFDGILIGLAASQSHALLSEARGLGSVGRPLAAISLGVAVVLMLVSAILALTVIFRAKSWVWSPDEIKNMPSHESVQSDKGVVQGAFLFGLTQRIIAEAQSYRHLSRRLNLAFATLAAGLTAVVISIGVYAVRTVQNPCPNRLSGTSTVEATTKGVPTDQFVDESSETVPSPFRCPKGRPGTRSPS